MPALGNKLACLWRRFLDPAWRSSIIEPGAFFTRATVLGGRNRLCRGADVGAAVIGHGTYVGVDSCLTGCRIGKWCSLGPRVRVVVGDHPSRDFVSTHPAFFSNRGQAGFTFVDSSRYPEFRYADEEQRFYVDIGHDVWIGDGALLMSGITLGTGAIIAAGAVVTKPVKPYCIVGGNPAREIRMRFAPHDVEWLLALAWWDRDEVWLRRHAACFESPDALRVSMGRQSVGQVHVSPASTQV